ncbi:PAS domain-containing protein [Fluviispira vulneris]|uniref:PAS domain-containing protein n=1 Tax=Fluviispira vulneris TaxID=2763012 RepID=UPI0016466318|nr:PAS domain-containing protein [Fluviispira vulneris]
MNTLPPMRRGILREVLKIVFLFGFLGFILIIIIHFSSKNPKNLYLLNFKSTSSIVTMYENWDTLYTKRLNHSETTVEHVKNFQISLDFLQNYYSTNQSYIVLYEIKKIFSKYNNNENAIRVADYNKMKDLLRKIMLENQYKLSKFIVDRDSFSNKMVLLACFIFLVALLFSIYFSERLSSKIAFPIKKISEVLQCKPDLNHKLKFPEPETLEIKFLTIELISLWKRLSDLHKKNLKNLRIQRSAMNTVFDAMEDAVVVVDSYGKIEHYNKLFLSVIGAKDLSLLFQIWYDVSLSSQAYIHLRNLVRRENFEESNFWAIVDGNECIFRVRKRYFYDEDMSKSGFIIVLHNLNNRFSSMQFKETAIKLKSEQGSHSI